MDEKTQKIIQELEGASFLTTNDDGETNNLSIDVIETKDVIDIVKKYLC